MSEEPKDLVLVRLDKVLSEMQAFRAEAHNDMLQVKARLTAVEKQLANQGESIAAQWEHFDKLEERLRNLEMKA
jgi:septal ring factor EnvC (AmiA/AmiB activator)